MAKFEVEYARFIKVKFNAQSQEEADVIASIMDEEEIEQNGRCEVCTIWNDPVQVS